MLAIGFFHQALRHEREARRVLTRDQATVFHGERRKVRSFDKVRAQRNQFALWQERDDVTYIHRIFFADRSPRTPRVTSGLLPRSFLSFVPSNEKPVFPLSPTVQTPPPSGKCIGLSPSCDSVEEGVTLRPNPHPR